PLPAASEFTVRVVNNVTKKYDVQARFLEAFGPEGAPDAFCYKQKVMLLFQTLDGVDVCLFCMYVQEYGADAPAPNARTAYLSYLDSVKYFRPEDCVSLARPGNLALRTVLYHELLVGYLAWIKARGFLTMYIWACPPLAGDDYILYCHPGRQKTPRSDRLREWYHAMLRAARSEGVVRYVSNLYDTFFAGGRDHRLDRPSILHLPYFEGDYWPGEAENLLAVLAD
ncbi:histone acetylation protein, partial [Helicosporidium sp. ATCC 50920]